MLAKGTALSLKTPIPIDDLRIVLYPHPALRQRCRPVDDINGEVAALAQKMLELMHAANGVGLAAPQVGLALRLFVCNHTGQPPDDQVWINPVLVELEGVAEAEEGCLSLPNVNVLKRRAVNAVIEGFDQHGQGKRVLAAELPARIWQHETDHLDGVLIIDNMPPSAELANRRILRQLEADYAAAKK